MSTEIDSRAGLIGPVKPRNVFESVGLAERYPHLYTDFEPMPVTVPTVYQPGSDGKIETLRRRAELGVELWHPNDPHCFKPDATGRTTHATIFRELQEAAHAEAFTEERSSTAI